ncbi:MAG: hypothetical protein LBJ63_11630 [Prevotellaceae bacterium]|jgi:hypothetical protein|nr:hypothetical protein [Prevotellaceae bacterium]
MKSISHKILSFVLCVAYILASYGFVRHVCTGKTDNVAYVSLLVNNECDYCLESRDAGHQCCHHSVKQQQSDDEDCCEKTVQKITEDQNCSHADNISELIFLALNYVIISYETNLVCSDLANSTIIYPPPVYSKTPLIYFTGQLRL